MKQFFIILSVLILPPTLYAQWGDISGQIPGNILTVAVNQEDDIFASTDQNKIYRSTNNGATWVNLEFPETQVNSFSFTSSQEIFASGYYGELYYSSDNGSSWSPRQNGIKDWDMILDVVKTPSGKLLAGAYTDCLSCNGGGIYESTDNGNSWNFLALLNNYINSIIIDFTDSIIYASGYPGVYRSSDDGSTWQLKNTGMLSYEFIKYVSFGSNNLIYAAADIYGGKMYKSSNQGELWIQIDSGLPEDFVKGLITYGDYVFVCYDNGGIFRTNDQGLNWYQVSYSIGNFEYNSLTKNNSNNLLVATSGGIFISDYNGDVWNKFTFSISHLLISSLFKTEGGNIITGTENGGVYISSDEGITWNQNSLVFTEYSYNVNHLKSSSDSKLFAAVNGYLIYKSLYMSTNQGWTWSHRGPNLQYGVNSLYIDNNDRILMGEYKKVYFSTDYGITWTSTTIYGATSQVFSIVTKPNNLVFAGTYHNGVFRSTDNGNSFTFSGIPNGQVYTLLVDSYGYIYAGCSPNIYRSTDDGLTWDIHNQGMGVTTVRDLTLFNEDTILAATTSGFYYSADQANNWTQLNEGLTTNFLSALAVDNTNQIYSGTPSGVFKLFGEIPVELVSFNAFFDDQFIRLTWQTATETNNQGFAIERKHNFGDWQRIGFVEGTGTTTETQSYSFVDDDVEAGKYQYRLKQIDYNGTYEYSEIIEVEIAAPAKFSLEQNYPNPFNPSTKIKFTVAESPLPGGDGRGGLQHVKLVVYDILGNEVATLVNEEKPAGEYEVEFNATGLPSGIYFYQIKAGSFIQTKKMILLR